MTKRLLSIALALALALCLCACKNNESPPEQTLGTSDIPSEEIVSSSPDESEAPATSEPVLSEDTTTSETEGVPDESVALEEEEEEVVDEYNYKTFEMLRRINSDRVHAKFTEAISYDGEFASTTQHEIFVDGENKVFLSDYYKVIIKDGIVIDIDLETLDIITYDYEYLGPIFGSEIYAYKPINAYEEDGVYTEIFTVESYDIVSTHTWVFYPDGTFTVSEVNEYSGTFSICSFEVVDDDLSGMDMSIPTEPSELPEFEE